MAVIATATAGWCGVASVVAVQALAPEGGDGVATSWRSARRTASG